MSRNLGLIGAGGDVGGVLEQLQKDLDYRGIALATPFIDKLFRLNPITKFFQPRKSGYFALRSKTILSNRLAEERADQGRSRQGYPPDFADRLLEAQRKDPSISEGQLVGYLQTNLVAGGDTTAIVLRTAIYYSLKNPWILRRIVEEVDEICNGKFPIPFRIARDKLPFCASVVRESLRKHFVFTGMMERETPAGGTVLPDGLRLPGGIVIGMHGDLIARDKNIFGDDADEFNPLRWHQRQGEAEDNFRQRLNTMNSHDLAFGHGPRSCIGKYVAEMEIYKFIPTFFMLLKVLNQNNAATNLRCAADHTRLATICSPGRALETAAAFHVQAVWDGHVSGLEGWVGFRKFKERSWNAYGETMTYSLHWLSSGLSRIPFIPIIRTWSYSFTSTISR